jgi:uncharacterized protein
VQHVFPPPPRVPWYKFWQNDAHTLNYKTAVLSFITVVLTTVLGFVSWYYKGILSDTKQQDTVVVSKKALINAPTNYADAQYLLGLAYKEGNGIAQDVLLAAKAFKEAANAGNAKAQFEFGMALNQGIGVTKSSKEAQKYFLLSANQGVADAQFMIGEILMTTGKNNPADYNTALNWYKNAANQNHLLAIHNIGVIYYNGDGVEKNCVEAYKWFAKAAELGRSEDQLIVATLLMSNVCVEEDEELAKEWLVKAANQGNIEAKKKLKELNGMKIIFIAPKSDYHTVQKNNSYSLSSLLCHTRMITAVFSRSII